MIHTTGKQKKELKKFCLLILTPIYPQAVKTLPHPGRSSGSLLLRRLPDYLSVAMSVAKISQTETGAYSSGNCTGLSPVSLLIRMPNRT